MATTRKMITRTRCGVPDGLATGFCEDPVLILTSAYLKQANPKGPVRATSDSRTTPGRAQGSRCPGWQPAMRPLKRGGNAQAQQMGRSAHSNEYAGPARQGRFRHGHTEQEVANQEGDCSQPN